MGRILARQMLAVVLTGLASLTPLRSECQTPIQVEGVNDRDVFTGERHFRIPSSEGYRHEATLNGDPIPPQLWIPVTEPGFYELKVIRRPFGRNDGTAPEHKTVRFVREDSERGGSETGLSPWTPRPLIDSPPSEADSRTFRFIYPSQWPANVRLPVVVIPSSSSNGLSLGRNTQVEWASYPEHAIRVKRGYGHGFLPPPSEAGQLRFETSEGRDLTIQVEESTQWTEIERLRQSAVQWGPDARIKIVEDLTIPADASLTIREGSVILLDPGVDIRVLGRLEIEGTRDEPVVWMPSRPNKPWGGLVLPEASGRLESKGAIFTGSGENLDWFVDEGIANTHRKEQAFAFLGHGSVARFSDSYLVDHSGQAFHGEKGTLHLDRCLIQGFTTAGQFNGGAITARQSAFIDFPNDSSRYVDGDNDAVYLTKGNHAFHDTLIGWCKDDGIDAGGSTGGTVTVEGCWIEACFHEGMALSGQQKQVQVDGSVFLNSGQGVEAGYLSPQVDVRQSLFLENQVGARFGDNYDWGYAGKLHVNDSVLLFNDRNVWGMVFDEWRQKRSRMRIENNLLSSSISHFPNNTLADNQTYDDRLAAFPRPTGDVGIGFANPSSKAEAGDPHAAVTVGLSTFSTAEVTVEVLIEEGAQSTDGTPIASPSTLRFAPGEMYKELRLQFTNPPKIDAADSFTLRLKNAEGASIISHQSRHTVQIFPSGTTHTLLSKGVRWRFRKGKQEASNPATAWRKPDHDDSDWPQGSAPFGYGDGDYGTPLTDMRYNYTSVFLRRTFTVTNPLGIHWLQFQMEYDDGLILWLNGREVLRRGVPGEAGDFLPFDATANRSDFGPKNETVTVSLDQLPPLRRGENQLAVQVFNHRLDSSDLTFDLALLHKDLGDRDADGLPDGWEYEILARDTTRDFKDLRDIQSTVDMDGDRVPTWREYLVRTDPTASTSVLHLEWTRTENGEPSLRLRAKPHINYRVEQRESLSATTPWKSFVDISPSPSSRSIAIEVPTTTSPARQFFRVRANP